MAIRAIAPPANTLNIPSRPLWLELISSCNDCGSIPGIRPGESTALYIDNILTKLTTIGALYLALVCLMPEFLIAKYPIPFYLGGTSILIVVIVAMDTVTQVQTRLMSVQYQSLIKKARFGKN